MNPEEILKKYAAGNIGQAEKTAFKQWLQTLTEREYHQLLMTYEQFMLTEEPARSYDAGLLEAINRRIAEDDQGIYAGGGHTEGEEGRFDDERGWSEGENRSPVGEEERRGVIRMSARRFRLRLAAASILLLLGVGVALLISSRGDRGKPVAGNTAPSLIRDISAPVLTHATLTLANGTAIVMDSVGNGSLAVQGTTRVTKLADGRIAYSTAGNAATVMYNTFTVPRGGKVVSMKLSDGTQVWLNSESSLRYPVAFGAGERKVVITGEAYFEVSRDPARKFLVVAGGTSTEVLGTHFNVNAYGDKGGVRVTLLEGKVKVRSGAAEQLVVPGEQAGLDEKGVITLSKKTDLEAVMAWKNGLFKFNDEDLQGVMDQIHRWYNVEVVYEGRIRPLNFGGVISRRERVSAVLELLELTKTVKFRIEPSTDGTSAGKVVVEL
jgi:transmembrane sensor